MSADRPALRQLAEVAGILPAYWDISGKEHVTSDVTREALLAAMGLLASDERAAARALDDLREAARGRLLPPARVARPGPARRITVRAPGQRELAWKIHLRTEDGGEMEASGVARPRGGVLRASLRDPLPLGRHQLVLSLRGDGYRREGTQALIVTPGSCLRIPEVLGSRRAWGVWCNLYSIRGRSRLGVGCFSDLERLGVWTAAQGGSFVGINPVHAVDHATGEPSPYRPRTRLFRNPLYLDVDRVPEAELAPEALRHLAETAPWLRAGDLVDYGAATAALERTMEALFAAFQRDAPAERHEAFDRFRREGGRTLELYATFLAIQESRRQRGETRPWQSWPEDLRDPRSSAVAAATAEMAQAVARHAWTQFELERQLGDVSGAFRKAGLRIGIYGDLALGSAPEGFDSWAFPALFATGASLGAPPDPFAAQGQDWGIPPMVPSRLAEDGYAFWTDLLRANLRHLGMLRIDHVMGVLRQFWVPQGLGPAHGAYVRLPSEDLLGILALESRRAGCLVVGEDLGTVPEGFRALMARWGLLSSQVLYFERMPDGALRPPGRFRRRSLATIGTHDLPPLHGYLTGRDIELRHAAGEYGQAPELASVRATRRHDAERMVHSLGEREPRRVLHGAHSFLARTRATLVGVSLDDLAGEDEPVNLPGIPSSRHPSFSRKMKADIDAVLDGAAELVAPLAARRLGPTPARSRPPRRAGTPDR